MVSLADKYAILGQHAEADMMRAQAEQGRNNAMMHAEYANRMAAQNPQNIALEREKQRSDIAHTQAQTHNVDATTNRTNMLAPYERDKMGAETGKIGAETNKIYGMLPYEQRNMAAHSNYLDAGAYDTRAQGYKTERENTPFGAPTPTDPRSLAYGSTPIGAGMAAPGGSYAPGPRTVSAPPAYGGTIYGSSGVSAPPPPTVSGAPGMPPQGYRSRTASRLASPAMVGDALGDNEPSLKLPKPAFPTQGFSPLATHSSATNAPFASSSSLPPLGQGIMSAPSSEFTSGMTDAAGTVSRGMENFGSAFDSPQSRALYGMGIPGAMRPQTFKQPKPAPLGGELLNRPEFRD